ncbi:MAG: 4Fe-4S binding protein, partial [Xanthomonadales bacterium]|nr:4Fe-4S binding protein [Xanthomonadales bacterium]
MNDATINPLVQSWSESYRPDARSAVPPWLADLRDGAAQEFARSGLPQRKDEAWKYTPVRALEALAPRFWCSHLCPLGTLLGLSARLGPLRRAKTGDER